VVLEGGKELYQYDTDAELLFRQESNFYYLFGINEPNCYGVFDLDAKESILFIPRLGVEYEVWCGKVKPCAFYKEKYAVDDVQFADELAAVLKKRNIQVVHTLYGKNTDSGCFTKEAQFSGREEFKVNNSVLYNELTECRVFKSDYEIQLLRYVNDVSSQAHIQVMREVKVGMYEYELEAIFKYYTFRRGGCRYLAYTCICGSGHNSATLHYGHAGAPNDKLVQPDDMLLLDMGAEYHGYGSDITCSFPASGKFDQRHKQIYEMVLAAQQAVIAKMAPGVLWSDMHRLAERVICEHLVKHQFIIPQSATIDDLIYKHHIPPLFFPHGLGHLLGLDVHDVGGYPAHEAGRINEPGIRKLRTNRVLKPGMFVTVEPGVYFIEGLLRPALEDEAIKGFLNGPKIQQFMNFGGVRLEDDVLVTETGCENLTKCPRTIAEIEAVMAGAPFPLVNPSQA